jgi:CIC family chloride channel protein
MVVWFRNTLGKLRTVLWKQLAKRTPAENAFLFLVPTVGVVTGVSALGIAYLIAYLQRIFWYSVEFPLEAAELAPWYMRIGVLAFGGAIVGLIGRVLKVETRGHGTSSMIEALALRGGKISVRQTGPRVIAGIVTVSCGGSLGREGPAIQFAAATASRLARQMRLSRQQVRILVCCGVAASISAIYNSPFGGAMFAMEILIGNFSLEVFGPVVIASVISTEIFRNAMGNLPRFVIPTYEMVSPWELGNYLVLGILAGALSIVFMKVLFKVEDVFKSLRIPLVLKPVIGLAAVGVIGCWLPQVFGNGYNATNLVLHEDPHLTLELLLVLPAAKILATAITAGSGGAGGIFTPSMMIGALLGGAFGYGAHSLFPQHTAGYGAYALVGMGGVLAGSTHAPITAIMMIVEQTKSYQIILPLMFVCIVSNFTARLLHRESLHHAILRRRGVVLPRGLEESIMQNLRVGDVMHDDTESVKESESFATIVDQFLKSPHNFLYVTVGDRKYYGAISLQALKQYLRDADSLDGVIAYDLVDPNFPFATRDQRLADTMETFWKQNCERLPVVDNEQNHKLVGWISKRDLIGIYNQEILQKRQLLSKFTKADRERERDIYVELPKDFEIQTVSAPESFVGSTLGDIAPGSAYNVQVLQIRRRDPVTGAESAEAANATARLLAGDQLVVVGTNAAIAKFKRGVVPSNVENWEI